MTSEEDTKQLLITTLKLAAKNCDAMVKLRIAVERAVGTLKYGGKHRIERALELLERGLE
jgi:hypothetical protein